MEAGATEPASTRPPRAFTRSSAVFVAWFAQPPMITAAPIIAQRRKVLFIRLTPISEARSSLLPLASYRKRAEARPGCSFLRIAACVAAYRLGVDAVGCAFASGF